MEKKRKNTRKTREKKQQKIVEGEVSEIFEIEKNGKEEIVQKGVIEKEEKEKAPTDEQIKKEKKTFRNVMIVMGVCVLFFLATYFIINWSKQFNYNGVNFVVDKTAMAGKTLYKTSIPVLYQGNIADYNIYLRRDPRTTGLISFDGTLNINSNMVINITQDFNCNGDGIIGVANFLKLYNLIGTTVIKDENATCDDNGDYMFVKIKEGNETKIEQFGTSCYNIYIKDCEILEGTERFMLETFIETNKALKESS